MRLSAKKVRIDSATASANPTGFEAARDFHKGLSRITYRFGLSPGHLTDAIGGWEKLRSLLVEGHVNSVNRSTISPVRSMVCADGHSSSSIRPGFALLMEPKAKLPYRIAIVGGGIGGLCAALQLHYHCKNDSITIDVYEQAAQYCEIGAGVGIGVNAAKLLHRIGIGDELNAIAGCRQGMWISFRRFDNGDEIVTVPADDTKSIRQAPVHRAEFLDLLLKTVRERRAARLHTKKVCSKVNVRLQAHDALSR